jgi:hypothetical protein
LKSGVMTVSQIKDTEQTVVGKGHCGHCVQILVSGKTHSE